MNRFQILLSISTHDATPCCAGRASAATPAWLRLPWHGRAVQVDPIKPRLRPPGTKHLILKCDVLLSTSAFKFNLRRYTMGVSRRPVVRRSAASASAAAPDSCTDSPAPAAVPALGFVHDSRVSVRLRGIAQQRDPTGVPPGRPRSLRRPRQEGFSSHLVDHAVGATYHRAAGPDRSCLPRHHYHGRRSFVE